MSVNSTDWENAWRETQSRSIIKVNTINEKGWEDYWDYVAPQYLDEVLDQSNIYREIIEHLRDNGVFSHDDDVLDIACGPGTYTFLFAETARSVTALDPSKGMLSTLMGEAARRRLSNIIPVQARWDEYVPGRKYDLIFTALSPGVNGPETLMKMEDHSRRSCCYITFADTEEMNLRNRLWELVIGEYSQNNSYNVTYPFNMLYQKGRKPTLRLFEHDLAARIPSDRLIESYIIYFGIFTDMDEEKKNRISEYIGSMSKDGFYEKRAKKSLAVMHWDVPEEKRNGKDER